MNASVDTSQILILQDFFKDLSALDQKKIFQSAFRKAAKPLVEAAKANAPVRRGTLQKSIGTMAMPTDISIIVGAMKRNKGWHGHLVESGTVERYRKTKKGASTGKMPGTKFFENAYNATEKQIFDTIEQEWLQEIDRMIIRTNRRLK